MSNDTGRDITNTLWIDAAHFHVNAEAAKLTLADGDECPRVVRNAPCKPSGIGVKLSMQFLFTPIEFALVTRLFGKANLNTVIGTRRGSLHVRHELIRSQACDLGQAVQSLTLTLHPCQHTSQHTIKAVQICKTHSGCSLSLQSVCDLVPDLFAKQAFEIETEISASLTR